MINNESEKMIFKALSQSLENIFLIQKELVINKKLDVDRINKTIENLIAARTLFSSSEESSRVQFISSHFRHTQHIGIHFNRINISYRAVFSCNSTS